MRTQAETTVTVVKHPRGGGTVLLAAGDGAGVRFTFDYWESARLDAFVALLDRLAAFHAGKHTRRNGKRARKAKAAKLATVAA